MSGLARAATAALIILGTLGIGAATADAGGYDNGRVIVIGEHSLGTPFDLTNDDRLDVRYDVTATGGHITADCAASGGTVKYAPIPYGTYGSDFNGYYCQGIDF